MKNIEGCIHKIGEADIILESGFIYEIVGCTEEEMHNINAIKSEKAIFSYIKEN